MNRQLALLGGPAAVSTPLPHHVWPPRAPGLGEAVRDYIDSGQPLSIMDRSGVYETLEERLRNLMDRRHALLTSSGTMALYSAFFGLGLEPGDEAVVTACSFHATATPLLHLGVKTIFCDVEPDTGNIDPARIEELITPRTRAVVTNHMWGHPVDAAAVADICRRRNVAWVEDCSHAHFAEYRGRFVGSFGDAAVFSLQGNKLLTGGEGGVLLTDSSDIYERAVLLGHYLGRSAQCVQSPQWRDLRRTGFGLKLRMHPLAAVTILHLLEHHCFDWIAQRAETLRLFSDALTATGLIQPMARRDYVTSMGAHYGFKPRLAPSAQGVSRDRLVEALRAEGVDVSGPSAPPLPRLPLFAADRYRVAGFEKADNSGRSFPGADAYHASIISLPTFTFPEERNVLAQYVDAFHKVAANLEALR